MELNLFEKVSHTHWEIRPHGSMRVPGIIYATEELVRAMDQKVYEQLCHVASLPGIVNAAYAMPDAHWGYGFPIGGVAAFDPQEGVISAGGVGFDISCGVRLLKTGIKKEEIVPYKEKLANILFKNIPSGVGSRSGIHLNDFEMKNMLERGAVWAVKEGYGYERDLEFIEENGKMKGADPDAISSHAKERQRQEMGTLGSGNHYLEVQEVDHIDDPVAAKVLGLNLGDIVISIHCGSRGLGHQIGSDFLRLMVKNAKNFGIELPDRELACAPIVSDLGAQYLGAMRGGINCALANRQILTHFVRNVWKEFFTHSNIEIIYDVSHNTCKHENHMVKGKEKELYVHRKGATRAFGPNHPGVPDKYRSIGQPVFIGGSMGVGSYALVGAKEGESLAFSSACHGAGRAMSRTEAKAMWSGPQIMKDLKEQGIIIRSGSFKGIAEEAPLAYKNLMDVVNAAEEAGLSHKVARLIPHICIKG